MTSDRLGHFSLPELSVPRIKQAAGATVSTAEG